MRLRERRVDPCEVSCAPRVVRTPTLHGMRRELSAKPAQRATHTLAPASPAALGTGSCQSRVAATHRFNLPVHRATTAALLGDYGSSKDG